MTKLEQIKQRIEDCQYYELHSVRDIRWLVGEVERMRLALLEAGAIIADCGECGQDTCECNGQFGVGA